MFLAAFQALGLGPFGRSFLDRGGFLAARVRSDSALDIHRRPFYPRAGLVLSFGAGSRAVFRNGGTGAGVCPGSGNPEGSGRVFEKILRVRFGLGAGSLGLFFSVPGHEGLENFPESQAG